MKLNKGEYVKRDEFTLEEMNLLAMANGAGFRSSFGMRYYGMETDSRFSVLLNDECFFNVTQKYKQWLKENKVDKIKVEFECDLAEAIMLKSFVGLFADSLGCDHKRLREFVEGRGVKTIGLIHEHSVHGLFLSSEFEKECRELASRARRKTVKVGDNEYYEDDLCNVDWEAYNAIREQLAKIKPVG